MGPTNSQSIRPLPSQDKTTYMHKIPAIRQFRRLHFSVGKFEFLGGKRSRFFLFNLFWSLRGQGVQAPTVKRFNMFLLKVYNINSNKTNSTNLYPPTKGYLRETCKTTKHKSHLHKPEVHLHNHSDHNKRLSSIF